MRRTLELAMLAAVLFLSGSAMTTAQSPATGMPALERMLTVSGTGTVAAEPDNVHISLGVVAEGETAKAALESNSRTMSAVVQALKARGLAQKDIQTSNFSVSPRYRQSKGGEAPAITGYQVQNTVRIVLQDIGSLGAVLDQMIQLGANQVHGISFEVSRADALRDEARKAAVGNARRKAEIYAQAAGAKVGRVLGIEEAGVEPVRPQRMYARSASMGAESAPPIEAGSQRLEARITVTFALE